MNSNIIVKYVLSLSGGLVALLQPTFPFLLICLFAVILDCWTAYRLSRRIKKKTGKSTAKFQSKKAKKIFGTLVQLFCLIVLADLIDRQILTMFDGLKLANYVAAVFCFVQFWSILENESSQNDAKWAKVIQKIAVDKAERHFDIDLSILKDEEK